MAIVLPVAAVGLEEGFPLQAFAERIARFGGGVTPPPQLVDAAKIAVQDAVRVADRQRVWMDAYTEALYNTIAGTNYQLPSRFRHPAGPGWLIDASGRQRFEIHYRQPVIFRQVVHSETTTGGLPRLYTIINRVTTGQLTVYPLPSATTITNYPQFRIPYFSGLTVPKENGQFIVAGEVLESAIYEEALFRFYRLTTRPDLAALQVPTMVDAWRAAERDDNMRRANTFVTGSRYSPWTRW